MRWGGGAVWVLHLVPSTNHRPRAQTAVSQLLLQVANKFRALSYNLNGLQGTRLFPPVWQPHCLPSRLSIVLLDPFFSPKIKSVLGTPTLFLPKPLRYLPLQGLGLVIVSGDSFSFHWTALPLSQDQSSLPGVDPIQT